MRRLDSGVAVLTLPAKTPMLGCALHRRRGIAEDH